MSPLTTTVIIRPTIQARTTDSGKVPSAAAFDRQFYRPDRAMFHNELAPEPMVGGGKGTIGYSLVCMPGRKRGGEGTGAWPSCMQPSVSLELLVQKPGPGKRRDEAAPNGGARKARPPARSPNF